MEVLIKRIREAKKNEEQTSIAFLGNIVDVWERLAQEEDSLIDLGSDQTSLHNPYGGGYYPAGLSVEQSQQMIVNEP
jgi:urocanate hydratase